MRSRLRRPGVLLLGLLAQPGAHADCGSDAEVFTPASEDHTGAVLSGGGLYLWGRGDWGQLGTGDGRSHWKPRAVRGVNVAPPVSAERFLAFAGGAEGDSERTSEEERGAESIHM